MIAPCNVSSMSVTHRQIIVNAIRNRINVHPVSRNVGTEYCSIFIDLKMRLLVVDGDRAAECPVLVLRPLTGVPLAAADLGPRGFPLRFWYRER